MTLEQLKEWIKVQITKHPEHKEEMLDLYSLCIDEIADGGSEWNEVQLCISSIEELLEEKND